MAKIRVHELARELGITSKRVMEVLDVLGTPVRSHSSTLSSADADNVRRKLREPRAGSGLITTPMQARRAGRATGLRGRLSELRDRVMGGGAEVAEEETSAPARTRSADDLDVAEPVLADEGDEIEVDVEELVASAARATGAQVVEAVQAPEPRGEAVAEAVAAPVRRPGDAPPKIEEPEAPTEPIVIAPVEAAVVRREVPGVDAGADAEAAQPDVDFVLPQRTWDDDAEVEEEEAEGSGSGATTPMTPPRGVDSVRKAPSKAKRDRRQDRESREARTQRKPKIRKPVRPTPGPGGKAVEVGAVVEITDPISVRGLAEALSLDTADVLRELLVRGAPSNINASVPGSVAQAIASDLGISVEIVEAPPAPPVVTGFRPVVEPTRAGRHKKKKAASEGELRTVPRPPVVTVMGHVDHGKTKLLDRIRKTDVASGESGGITQPIGASEIAFKGKSIVFLDTPGHEAFSAMRARGAQVTDIAILVVAADDGVMPQTIEAINHARAAGVPIIVAVNKMDLPAANPDRVLQQLTHYDLMPEEWGGDAVCVRVSAIDGTGINELLDMILLVAEMGELTAEVGGETRATVIEAKRDSSRGPVATVVVSQGILNSGDSVVVGSHAGKIRALHSPSGKRVRSVEPGYACEIWGLEDVPSAGDELRVVESQKVARQMARDIHEVEKARAQQASGASSLALLMEQIQAGEVSHVNLVLKADVHGSLEAITQALEKLEHPEVQVKIAHSGVGSINESDVTLASAARAIIIGFHVGMEPGGEVLARNEGIEVRQYPIIYEIIEDVKDLMTGNLRPVFEEVVLGHAEVRAIFKISRTGTIAGCAVTDGTMKRNETIRVFRGDNLIYEGNLDSLRHVKDDVNQVEAGRECGISLNSWNGFDVADVIECYTMRQLTRSLTDGLTPS